jgi:hypothetical protein
MAHGHQNATRVTVALTKQQADNLDALFRQRRVGAKDPNRAPSQSERETLVHDLVTTAVGDELAE